MLVEMGVIAGVVVFVLIITILIGGRMTRSELEKDIEKLFLSSENISDKIYSSEQVKHLPDPVQRYFKYSLLENQHYISNARLKHGGKFNPGQKWFPIKGEEYFTIQNPGFVWFGKLPFFSARDMYYDGKGYMKVKLLSVVKIIDARGREIDQGALVRWLGEAPWFPTALLPSEKLKWEPIDNDSAKIILTDKNLTIDAVFYFNEQGQITKFNAKRYRYKVMEKWLGVYRDYKEIEGMQIPHYVEVTWNLESCDFTYDSYDLYSYRQDKLLAGVGIRGNHRTSSSC